jgi:hypothetical protein
MYNKVKELSREELISRNTGLDRATVRKYLRMTEEEFSDFLALQNQRNRKLQPYEEFIKGLPTILIAVLLKSKIG